MIIRKMIAVATALTITSCAAAEGTAGPVKHLVSAVAASTGADSEAEKTYDIFRYMVTQAGKAVITGIDEDASGDIVVPAEFDEITVDSFNYSVFYGNDDSLTGRITSITIPDSFSEYSLRSVPGTIPVKPADDSEKYYVENGFTIARKYEAEKNVAVSSAEKLSGEVSIPEGVTRMAFDLAENHDITVINVPSTLRYLGYVYDMPSLKEINVAEGNEKYFSYKGAFGRYAHLPRYEWDESSQKYKLNNNAVRKDILAVPEGYEGEFVVEDGVELAFQGEAFSELTKLTAVKLGKDTELYGGFSGCTSLETIEIHGSAPYMNRYDLIGSKFYEEHEDGLLYSGDTLLGCKGLSDAGGKITVKDGTAYIADNAFAGLEISEINIPASVVRIGANALDARGLKAVNVDPNNKNYSSADGVLFDKDGKMLKVYPNSKKDESYVVPNGTEVIASMAFAGNTYLKHVDLPDSVEFISGTGEPMDGAFFDCTSLEELVVPEKVKDMDWCELYNCKLKVLALPESVSAYGQIPYMKVNEIYRDENGTPIWCDIDWNSNSYGSGAECDKIIFRNPQCDIANVRDTVIVGYKGSTAEKYAKENSLTAEALEGEQPTEPVVTTAANPETSTTMTTTITAGPTTDTTAGTAAATAEPAATTASPTTAATEPPTTMTEPPATEAPVTATEPAETEPATETGTAVDTLPVDIGDVNSDDIVDSSDASEVLLIYASVSTGGELSEEQKSAADINRDGLVDSADASLILEYYAYVSTGGKDTAEVYFTKQQIT